MFAEFLRAFGLIFLAEMGDKTQILAMAFATRYSIRQVLWGIFFGVLANHGLAVVLGSLLSSVLPMDTIQLIAGAAFLGFALWSLRLEEGEEESNKASSGPVMTVALAFFIGELGDKTQLSAITLSSMSQYPLLILAGTVTGMLLVGLLGIIVGRLIGDKVPEVGIKLAAAAVFAFFGLNKLLNHLPQAYLAPQWFVPAMLLYSGLAIYLLIQMRKAALEESALKTQAQKLKDFYSGMSQSLEEICLHCQRCVGSGCHVGYSKLLLSDALAGQPSLQRFVEQAAAREKTYPSSEVAQALRQTSEMLKQVPHDLALLHLKKQLQAMQAPEHLPVAHEVLHDQTGDTDQEPEHKTESQRFDSGLDQGFDPGLKSDGSHRDDD